MEEDKITLEELKKGIEGEEKIILKTSVILDLIKHIEKLEEENKELKEEFNSCEFVNKLVNENYISKQAIRDKIEELHNKIYEHQGKKNLYGYDVHDYIEKFKEELLEERNK